LKEIVLSGNKLHRHTEDVAINLDSALLGVQRLLNRVHAYKAAANGNQAAGSSLMRGFSINPVPTAADGRDAIKKEAP